jgi:hypothetical protein
MTEQDRFRTETTAARPDDAGLLQERLIALAGTPDDSALVEKNLSAIARLAASRIDGADHASVTRKSGTEYATVAATSDCAVAADEAQYCDKTGPCLEALEAGYPAAVPDIASTITWPTFRDIAGRLRMYTSLSVPLFAGSGTTIASLNLYSHRHGSLHHLTTAVWNVYEPDIAEPWERDSLDPGSRELTAGLIGAIGLRGMLQRAIAVIVADDRVRPDEAYRTLHARATADGDSLIDTAARLIEQIEP